MTPFIVPIFSIVFVLLLAAALRKTGRWNQETARDVVAIVVFLAIVDIVVIWWRNVR
jgi:hypothetical protein